MSSISNDPWKAYASMFGTGSISHARIRRLDDDMTGSHSISYTRTVRDLDEDKSHSYAENLLLTSSMRFHRLSNLGVELAKNVATEISPSGNKTLILRMASDDKPAVEIQSNPANGKSFVLDVSAVHGHFVADTWFGGVSWSSDERFVVYVAQQAKHKPATSSGPEADNAVTGFELKEDWGERYVEVSDTQLCVIDTMLQTASLVPGIDVGSWTVGQPVFLPADTSNASPAFVLVYTAWRVKPRRLGMIYCYHRPCSLFAVDLTSMLTKPPSGDSEGIELQHTNLTGDKVKLARSARCTADGQLLVFLGHITGFDTHSGPTQLFTLSVKDMLLGNAGINLIIDEEIGTVGSNIRNNIMQSNSINSNDSLESRGPFPGLFLDSLPKQCFVRPRQLVLSSSWGSRDSLLLIDLEQKSITPLLLTDPSQRQQHQRQEEDDRISSATVTETGWNLLEEYTVSILDISEEGQIVLFAVSSPNLPHTIGAYHVPTNRFAILDSDSSSLSVGISKKYQSPGVEESYSHLNLQSIRWKILRYVCPEDGIPMESILLLPRQQLEQTVGDDSFPLIVVPHGGPHGCIPTWFDPSMAFLCLYLQSAVLLVNYRGSTAFGAASIASLPGNCGRNDMQDIITCIDSITKHARHRFIDATRISIVGGSHGGFLAAHAVGQYPDIFKAAVLRNPVTNIAAMVSVSDIPDWCHIEAKGIGSYSFDTFQAPSQQDLQIMREVSPIHHVNSITSPVLILLGQMDLRVPYSQGIEFYHILRAREVPTKCLVFPKDVHKIDKPKSEAAQWVETVKWLQVHVNRE